VTPIHVALLGGGALASALHPLLTLSGLRVTPWQRGDGFDGVSQADLAWIAVSDRAIGQVAAALARAGPPSVVLHSSGFHGPEVLAPLVGVAKGVLHPLVSFPAGAPPSDLRGATFSLAGDPEARVAAGRLVRALGGQVLELPDDPAARAAYHASAALTAGGIVALLDLALETFPGDASALAHLASGVLGNIAALGTGPSLTGPVMRGDAEVLRAHLELLPPDAREVYRLLARRMLTLAEARGLDSAAADDLRASL
jgi:predicted short-subunit dehydrogenase-like oxidoreductase (DUF2520 family)